MSNASIENNQAFAKALFHFSLFGVYAGIIPFCPYLVHIGPHLVQFGPHLVQSRPHLVPFGPHLILFGPHLVSRGSILVPCVPHLVSFSSHLVPNWPRWGGDSSVSWAPETASKTNEKSSLFDSDTHLGLWPSWIVLEVSWKRLGQPLERI